MSEDNEVYHDLPSEYDVMPIAPGEEEIELLRKKLALAIELLAEWCYSVDENGADWDYWDDFYKEAMHGKNILREDIDKKIEWFREHYKQDS